MYGFFSTSNSNLASSNLPYMLTMMAEIVIRSVCSHVLPPMIYSDSVTCIARLEFTSAFSCVSQSIAVAIYMYMYVSSMIA